MNIISNVSFYLPCQWCKLTLESSRKINMYAGSINSDLVIDLCPHRWWHWEICAQGFDRPTLSKVFFSPALHDNGHLIKVARKILRRCGQVLWGGPFCINKVNARFSVAKMFYLRHEGQITRSGGESNQISFEKLCSNKAEQSSNKPGGWLYATHSYRNKNAHCSCICIRQGGVFFFSTQHFGLFFFSFHLCRLPSGRNHPQASLPETM